ncbi:MAG: TMEM175 family protein [Ginsengibacter sp.]
MKINTTRLESFSDGVIAIIITIMILALKLPVLDKHITTTAQTVHYLKFLLPYFITYAFSFMMIGIFWTNHHHMFNLLEKTDMVLLWQNFLFLFVLSLIPFATAVVGANPFIPIAPVIYGIIMLLTTLSFVIMRNHAIHHKLIHSDENKALTRKIFSVSLIERTKATIATSIYLVSIPLAFVSVYLSYACFVISPVIFFLPKEINNEKLAEKISAKNVLG